MLNHFIIHNPHCFWRDFIVSDLDSIDFFCTSDTDSLLSTARLKVSISVLCSRACSFLAWFIKNFMMMYFTFILWLQETWCHTNNGHLAAPEVTMLKTPRRFVKIMDGSKFHHMSIEILSYSALFATHF